MSGWDLESGGSKKQEFMKLSVGLTSVRIVDDAPHQRWTHWLNSHRRAVNCPGRSCPICEIRKQQKANKQQYTVNMQKKCAMQVINRTTGKLEIMEQGVEFFEELKMIRAMLAERQLTFRDVDIDIRRKGTSKDDTSYRIDIGAQTELTADDLKLIEEMIDLKDYFKPHEPGNILKVLDGADWNETMYPKAEEEPEAEDGIGEDEEEVSEQETEEVGNEEEQFELK